MSCRTILGRYGMYRANAVMTRLKRMSHGAQAHEYWRFLNYENEGVYIVASRTHYPILRLMG
jgi:hypothetical protein